MTVRNRQNKKQRVLGKILFCLYIAFLVYFLIFSERYGREPGTASYRYNLQPFQEIKRFWVYRKQLGFIPSFTNLAGNILIFIPFGFFFATTVFFSFFLSLTVEMVQFITQVGSFDVDDILLNTLGGLIGYILFALMHEASLKKRRRQRKRRE